MCAVWENVRAGAQLSGTVVAPHAQSPGYHPQQKRKRGQMKMSKIINVRKYFYGFTLTK
jgi:hypothetical protein